MVITDTRRMIGGSLLLLFIGACVAQEEPETVTVTNFEGFGDLTNVISTDRTRANLSCESGDMVVKLQFADKFRGVVYADRDRNSPCKTFGDGSSFYVFQIPLQGCGTKERVTSDYRMFVNDIVVRFHPSLELEGDEVKTILCRYPPPVAPLPPVIILPPLPVEAAVVAGPRHLSEVELMLIICAVLFLGLLLLGVGLAYYCLKKRNIKIVKQRLLSSGPPSEITKISASTMAPLSIPFDGIRIPRATAHSMSGSEALLTYIGEQSDIPSDYPSESPSLHSEVEEVETRQVQVSSKHMSSYDNQAYVREDYLNEQQTLVSHSPPSPPLRLKRDARSLTTIHEQEEMLKREEYLRMHAMVTQQQQRETPPPPPRYAAEPPAYARIRRRQMEQRQMEQVVRNESHSMTETTEEFERINYAPPPPLVPASIPDNDLKSMSEFSEAQRVRMASESHEGQSTSEYHEEMHMEQYSSYQDETDGRTSRSMSEYTEPAPAVATDTTVAKAAPTRHLIDDRYLTTQTDAYMSEDTSRRVRDITETHVKEIPPPKWDVLIRTYPPQQPEDNGDLSSEVETWDKFSVISERPRVLFESDEDTLIAMEVQKQTTSQTTLARQAPPNWDVLIRVLEPPATGDSDDVRSVLSEDDRDKWKAILTTDSTLRTRLTEARTTEEFEVIRRDERYEKLFDPPQWDVIIRILGIPIDTYHDHMSDAASVSDTASYTSERPAVRYRRKSDFEARSRRGSLPPLYEDDDPLRLPVTTTAHSRHTSRSSMTTDIERESTYSEDNPGSYPRQHRPSLMRSTSEVMESPEMIEKDSLDGHSSDDEDFRIPHRVNGKVLFERYPHTSPDVSPTSSPTFHRLDRRNQFLDKASSDVTVNSQVRTEQHVSEQRESHSSSRTEVHNYWPH